MNNPSPFYEDVQAHYDLSDEFFALFLDSTRTYSCAYFKDPDYSLEQAQLAKIDLSLGKCNLKPGLLLLDIGCGWGATALRAAEKYQVDVIGLTLSQNQFSYISERAKALPAGSGKVEFRLQGWEEFDEPVDRIVSIGAFEHFRKERHKEFFARCRKVLAPGGQMMLHSIVYLSFQTQREKGIDVNEEDIAFAKFIRKKIFPGGEICNPERMEALAIEAGFEVFHTQSLQLHYAQTLEQWATTLKSRKAEAVRLTSLETYDMYMHYLIGCAKQFRKGTIDLMQFCLR